MMVPHRPHVDDQLQRQLDLLAADGVHLLAEEIGWLVRCSAPLQDAWLSSLRRAATTRPTPRTVVRHKSPAAHPRWVPAGRAQQERVWRRTEDGLGFVHLSCGRAFTGFVDEAQAADAAVAHDRTCRKAGRDE